jgi:hypothetical protein
MNESKQQPQQPQRRPEATTARLDESRPIPIASLSFKEMLDIPGKLTSQGVKSDYSPDGNRKRWRVVYLPTLRHFQLDHYLPGASTPEASYFVHETLIAWWIPTLPS